MSSESGSSLSLHSILSPVDFSEQSRQALRWAAAFAARFRSGLTVVSVVDPLLAEVARIRWHQDLVRAGTEPALREFVAATWPDGPGLSQQMVFTTPVGDPAATILGTATTAGADLIVMGTRGLGGLQKWLLGSTTERVLRRTRVPVLAVPLANESHAAPEAGMVSRILAATDFSESSVVAAKTAAHLARVFSATLTLSHIVEPVTVPTQWQPLVDESGETRVADARARLQSMAAQIADPGKGDTVLATGRPEELIGSLAEERGAHMIVMGLASDQGPFSPRPGSIAYRVLCSTTIPVLVVPASHG